MRGVLRHQLLRLLASLPTRAPAQDGYLMAPVLLVLLALVVSSLGIVAVSNWSSLSSIASGDSADAQQVAEAGADQIIASFNQPENRQLLVADGTPPSSWSTTNANLRSPCLSSRNSRPGAGGFPTADAIDMGQGGGESDFRNLDNISQKNSGDRRFLLRGIRYSTGAISSTNRRSIYRTYAAGATSLASQSGSLPAGLKFGDVINLDDPDGAGPLRTGANTGFIAVTVEGRRYRPDGTFSSSIITKEYEVLPKCCGGSFGGNDTSGGPSTVGSTGADRRLCGIDFGMVVGINGGRFFSQAANDRYTRRNEAGAVTNIQGIVGIVSNPGQAWGRARIGLVNGTEVGCRTVPSPCNVAGDNEDRTPYDVNTIQYYYGDIIAATPGDCPVDQTGSGTNRFGDRRSIDGTAAGCIPFVPLSLSTGLPSIASRYSFNWTAASHPDQVSRENVTSSNTGRYPVFNLTSNGDGNVNIWLRANASNLQASDTTGMSSRPFLEYCNTKYLPGNNCASVYQPGGSPIHTWAVISNGGAVPGGIGDDFSSNGLAGQIAGSTPRWPSIWEERDPGFEGLTVGDLQIADEKVIFQDLSPTFTAGSSILRDTRPAIARAVNLHGIKNPVLEITYETSKLESTDKALSLYYSFSNPNTTNSLLNNPATNQDDGWQQLATVPGTLGGSIQDIVNGAKARGPLSDESRCESSGAGLIRCRIELPAAATASANPFSHWVKFRLRASSPLTNGKQVLLNEVKILSNIGTSSAPNISNPEYLNWCEYSSSFPATVNFTGGFHCLGPSINLSAAASGGGTVSRNRLWLDTTDGSISFYYNRPEDRRGIELATPLINLRNGATMGNVQCTRANPTTTAPNENCTTLVADNVFNPVGEYELFNIFGRDTPPAFSCEEFNVGGKPCMQIVAISADSSAAANATDRARLAGTWIYMPWGLVSFCVNGCGSIPALPFNELLADDSWNYGGRVWTRSLYAGGQNHFRIPPSSSAGLSALINSSDSASVSFVGWSGQDWVARASSGARNGVSLLNN